MLSVSLNPASSKTSRKRTPDQIALPIAPWVHCRPRTDLTYEFNEFNRCSLPNVKKTHTSFISARLFPAHCKEAAKECFENFVFKSLRLNWNDLESSDPTTSRL